MAVYKKNDAIAITKKIDDITVAFMFYLPKARFL